MDFFITITRKLKRYLGIKMTQSEEAIVAAKCYNLYNSYAFIGGFYDPWFNLNLKFFVAKEAD